MDAEMAELVEGTLAQPQYVDSDAAAALAKRLWYPPWSVDQAERGRLDQLRAEVRAAIPDVVERALPGGRFIIGFARHKHDFLSLVPVLATDQEQDQIADAWGALTTKGKKATEHAEAATILDGLGRAGTTAQQAYLALAHCLSRPGKAMSDAMGLCHLALFNTPDPGAVMPVAVAARGKQSRMKSIVAYAVEALARAGAPLVEADLPEPDSSPADGGATIAQAVVLSGSTASRTAFAGPSEDNAAALMWARLHRGEDPVDVVSGLVGRYPSSTPYLAQSLGPRPERTRPECPEHLLGARLAALGWFLEGNAGSAGRMFALGAVHRLLKWGIDVTPLRDAVRLADADTTWLPKLRLRANNGSAEILAALGG